MITKNRSGLPLYWLLSIISASIWTLLLSGFYFWNVRNTKLHTEQLSTYQARAFFQEIVTIRAWNSSLGGVYVPVTHSIQPNVFLEPDQRQIITADDKTLANINPSFMVRLISESDTQKNPIQFNITSSKPIRPDNAPDDWESGSLMLFEKGILENYEFLEAEEGATLFRYMAPLWVKKRLLGVS